MKDATSTTDLERARRRYEEALAAYDAVRFGQGPRSTEWTVGERLDKARVDYFGLRGGSLSDAPRQELRAPKFEPTASVRVNLSRIVAAALDVGPAVVLAAGLALPIGFVLLTQPGRPAGLGGGGDGTLTATSRPRAAPPTLRFLPEPGSSSASRFLDVEFTSDQALQAVSVTLQPDPGLGCEAGLETAKTGRIRCLGVLPGGQDFLARVTVSTLFSGVTSSVSYGFRTQLKLNKLEGVKWYTQFEDPSAEPLACAAASARIIQVFTTGTDPMSAEQILRFGRQFNRSRDPGLDPVAIATALKRLDARNNYHYYIHPTREEATTAAVYWLLRSGKPVVAITLGGQHAPLIVGYTGEFGDRYDDPANRLTGVIVMDPQRGDVDPRTARFRPDKDRSREYQTGRQLSLIEWYRDEWWLAGSYYSSYGGVSMDRNDGTYPLPHWAGNFVIIVDDGDGENPSDRLGRVQPR